MTTKNQNLSQPAYIEAFDAMKPELEAMTEAENVPIRHEIMTAIIFALGALPNLVRLREQTEARFGEDAARWFDKLEPSARACAYAHAQHLATLHGVDTEVMAGELSQVRTVFLYEVEALIAAGLLPGSVVAELVGGTSYKGLCLDVLQLVTVLRAHWASIEGHCAVQVAEIDHADALASAFSTALGENEVSLASTPTADMRRRAYSMFVRTHSMVRRYVTFFRWVEGDVDTIVPPLGAGRRGGANGDPPDEEAEPAPSPAPVATPTPTIEPGMPGADPFIRNT